MTPAHPQAFPLTFGTLLRESARRYPDKAAVVGYRGDTRVALSYGALDRAANRLANALQREGYAKSAAKSATKSEAAPGRWLAILSPNDVDYPAVHFGAARAGSPLAHVSVRANAAGRAEMLVRVGAELLFVHAAFADEARALLAASATLKRVVIIGGAEGPDSLDAFIGDAADTDPPVDVRAGRSGGGHLFQRLDRRAQGRAGLAPQPGARLLPRRAGLRAGRRRRHGLHHALVPCRRPVHVAPDRHKARPHRCPAGKVGAGPVRRCGGAGRRDRRLPGAGPGDGAAQRSGGGPKDSPGGTAARKAAGCAISTSAARRSRPGCSTGRWTPGRAWRSSSITASRRAARSPTGRPPSPAASR